MCIPLRHDGSYDLLQYHYQDNCWLIKINLFNGFVYEIVMNFFNEFELKMNEEKLKVNN